MTKIPLECDLVAFVVVVVNFSVVFFVFVGFTIESRMLYNATRQSLIPTKWPLNAIIAQCPSPESFGANQLAMELSLDFCCCCCCNLARWNAITFSQKASSVRLICFSLVDRFNSRALLFVAQSRHETDVLSHLISSQLLLCWVFVLQFAASAQWQTFFSSVHCSPLYKIQSDRIGARKRESNGNLSGRNRPPNWPPTLPIVDNAQTHTHTNFVVVDAIIEQHSQDDWTHWEIITQKRCFLDLLHGTQNQYCCCCCCCLLLTLLATLFVVGRDCRWAICRGSCVELRVAVNLTLKRKFERQNELASFGRHSLA